MAKVTLFLIDHQLGLVQDITELPSVTAEATSEETLGAVIERSVDDVRDRGSLSFVSEPDASGRRHLLPGPTAVLETDGGLRWVAYRQETVTLEELERSRERGLFEGDPQVFALDARPIGNGGLLPWNEVLDWISSFEGRATTILALRGLIAVIADDVRRLTGMFRMLWRRFSSKRDAQWLRLFLETNKTRWLEAGASSPSPLLHFVLKEREWDANLLSKYLRISGEDARRFLELLGYEVTPWSGLYVISQDPKKLRLRTDLVHVLLHGLDPLEMEDLRVLDDEDGQ